MCSLKNPCVFKSDHSEGLCKNDKFAIAEDPGISASPSLDYLNNASIKSDDDSHSTESEHMELYCPSSPFRVKEEFILPDIQEESDEAELNDSAHTPCPQITHCDPPDAISHHFSLDEGDLDIMETSFSEELLGILAKSANFEMKSLDTSNPPLLPISPPPGPLLTSELNTPLASIPTHHIPHRPPPNLASFIPKSYRHSVAGAMEDIPPPLPSSQPPGKLMSPRRSLFMDLADIDSASHNSMGNLDLSQLVPQLKRIREATDADKDNTVLERMKSNELREEMKENSGTLDLKEAGDTLPIAVPPPILDNSANDLDMTEDLSQGRQRLDSYHLRTFEPPKEFSDSGFQDTDNMVVDHHRAQALQSLTPELPKINISKLAEENQKSHILTTQKIDSSTTFTSDEQLTENSGSVGLKTMASSGSEV